MAKEKPKPAAKASDGIVIELKEGSKFGDRIGSTGDPIATVILEEGVSLNYLVDAIRNGIAHERNDEEDARKEAEAKAAEDARVEADARRRRASP